MGEAVAVAGRRQGLQEVLANETAEGGSAEAEPEDEMSAFEFCHERELMGFCHDFATVGAILARF